MASVTPDPGQEGRSGQSNSVLSFKSKAGKSLADFRRTSRNTISEDGLAKMNPKVIHPESGFAVRWNLLILVMIFYGMVMVPLRICFDVVDVGHSSNSPVVWISIMVDFIFCYDIYVHAHLAYKPSRNVDEYEFDLAKIRRRYLRSTFFIDFLAAFPFDLVVLIASAATGDVGTGENLFLTKIFKTFRLIRVAKLIKVSKIRGIISDVEDSFLFALNPGVKKLLAAVLVVLLISHTTACVWYWVSISEIEAGNRNAWVIVYMETDYQEKNYWPLYVSSLYWAVSTLTSVGFGDFAPQNNLERLLATFSCWLGATIFGYVIGQMSSMVADLNQASFQYHRKMDSINAYLNYRKVPSALQRRIRRFFRYYVSRKMLFDEQQILEDLTHGLKVELSMFLTKDLLKQIHIFREIDNPNFISALVTMLKPFAAAPGDFIFREGNVATEMYLIVRGTLEVVSGDGVVFSRLSDGQHFGEITHLENGFDERRACSVRAITYCDLFSFSKKDLASVTEHYPEVYQQMIEAGERRKAVAKNLREQKKARKVTTGNALDDQYANIPDDFNFCGSVSSPSSPTEGLKKSKTFVDSKPFHGRSVSLEEDEGDEETKKRSGSVPDYSKTVYAQKYKPANVRLEAQSSNASLTSVGEELHNKTRVQMATQNLSLNHSGKFSPLFGHNPKSPSSASSDSADLVPNHGQNNNSNPMLQDLKDLLESQNKQIEQLMNLVNTKKKQQQQQQQQQEQ